MVDLILRQRAHVRDTATRNGLVYLHLIHCLAAAFFLYTSRGIVYGVRKNRFYHANSRYYAGFACYYYFNADELLI